MQAIEQLDARRVVVQAPAKINLFLQVTGRRSDGYHELFTLMAGVSLFDTVRIVLDTPESAVRCDDPAVPEDAGNLAFRAAERFFATLAQRRTFTVTLTKRIPVGAGLGGGSSDAAAVLLGLNRLCGHPLPHHELSALGLSLGADVPFFLFQRPAVATGIGECLEAYDRLPPHAVLLVYPGIAVSTATVFRNLNLRLTKCQKALRYFSFRNGAFDVESQLCNDLETVTFARHPEIAGIKSQLLAAGARGASMTGSGSTVYGLFADRQKARQACDRLRGPQGWRLFVADLLI